MKSQRAAGPPAARDDVITPPGDNPAYAIRFKVPRPDGWYEERNVRHSWSDPKWPAEALVLHDKRTGCSLELSIVPGEGRTPVENLRQTIEWSKQVGGMRITDVRLDPSGMRASYRLEVQSIGGKPGGPPGRVGEHVNLRLPDMGDQNVSASLWCGQEHFAEAVRDREAIIGSFKVIRLMPQNDPARLAYCLAERGATLYATSTCPFCREQEKMFGAEIGRIRRVACDTREENPLCRQAEVDGVPTWVFKDGTRLDGLQSLEELRQATRCPDEP